ncbi:MAG: ATPase [Peptococcaceae bacterium]|jgi:cell division septum initiation protein DivIVA|nr:ATPase [Peptococcaceae bacterium]
MELFEVINELEELVDSSPRIPMTRRILVDEERILEFLDRIRTAMPEEMRQAKWVVQEREKVLSESRKEAQKIVDNAQKEVERRIDENEITGKARETADEIIHKAEKVSWDIKQGAHEYADDLLRTLQEKLDRVAAEVQQGRTELKSIKPGS